MTRYEHFEQLAATQDIRVNLNILREEDALDGLYVALRDGGSLILINRHRSLARRTTALAEELGHHFRSVGSLLDLREIAASKSEALAHAWSYEQLLPHSALENGLQNGNGTAWELAEATDLPEDFIQEAVSWHNRRHPRSVRVKSLPPEVQELIRKQAVIPAPDPVPPVLPPAPAPVDVPQRLPRAQRKKPINPQTSAGSSLGLPLSATIREDAEAAFGISRDDPRWESITYALVLTSAKERTPTLRTTRTYHFPPVKVRLGVLYKMTGTFVRESLQQRMFLHPFNRYI